MGCSTCGQKYKAPRTRPSVANPRPARINAQAIARPSSRVDFHKKARVVNPIFKPTVEVDQPPVTVAVQPMQSNDVPVPNYDIDPSTGQSVDIIKTGQCPEQALGGDKELAPQLPDPVVQDDVREPSA